MDMPVYETRAYGTAGNILHNICVGIRIITDTENYTVSDNDVFTAYLTREHIDDRTVLSKVFIVVTLLFYQRKMYLRMNITVRAVIIYNYITLYANTQYLKT